MGNFRWLHLSDFHIGKDNYGQIKLFSYLLEHIKERKNSGWIPDAVFITGDIANKGKEADYETFEKEFLLPLSDIGIDLERVYLVPGNHDVDRDKDKGQCYLASESLYSVLADKSSVFFDTDESGLKVRTGILDRFSEFQKKTTKGLCFPTKGIFEEKGCYVDTIKKENVNIGIIGVNTAWLSKSDQDEKKLSPGKYMLEEALNALNNCEYKIVLGHHPLSWFHDEQKKQICALLGKSKAMYLHGHMHKDSMEYFLIQSTGFLTLQCGAAFLAREDEKYYNSLQWGEIDLTESLVRITPKRWSSTNQMFIPDISENMPELFREEGKDSWLFHYTFTVSGTKKADGGTGLPEKMTIKVPEGWHWIDKTYIDQRKEAQDEDILKYFDGKEPSYSGIFSGAIPTRGIVHDIVREYIRCNEDQKIKCVLLTGAGARAKQRFCCR